jgi:hypothetical protein
VQDTVEVTTAFDGLVDDRPYGAGAAYVMRRAGRGQLGPGVVAVLEA